MYRPDLQHQDQIYSIIQTGNGNLENAGIPIIKKRDMPKNEGEWEGWAEKRETDRTLLNAFLMWLLQSPNKVSFNYDDKY